MFIFALGVLTCMYIHFSRGSLEGMLSLYSMLFFLRNGKRHINLATNARRKNVGIKLSPLNVVSLRITKCVSILTVVLWFTCLVLNLSRDIHPNPGPSSTLSTSDSDTSACSFEYIMGMFSVYHMNIQSVLPKIDIIEQEIQFYDVAVFTETWLNDTIQSDSIVISNFSAPHRLDRQGRIGGGVAIYVRDSLTSIRRHDLEIANLEAVWVEIKLKTKSILVGGFYRPPNSNSDYLDRIHVSIDRALNTSIHDIVILGDFNLNTLKRNDNAKIEDISNHYGFGNLLLHPLTSPSIRHP